MNVEQKFYRRRCGSCLSQIGHLAHPSNNICHCLHFVAQFFNTCFVVFHTFQLNKDQSIQPVEFQKRLSFVNFFFFNSACLPNKGTINLPFNKKIGSIYILTKFKVYLYSNVHPDSLTNIMLPKLCFQNHAAKILLLKCYRSI